MPDRIASIHTKRRFLLWEKAVSLWDTNCHSKSITVPVTVVLGLATTLEMMWAVLRNPRQMSFFRNDVRVQG